MFGRLFQRRFYQKDKEEVLIPFLGIFLLILTSSFHYSKWASRAPSSEPSADVENEMTFDELKESLTEDNPLYPYAIKPNGKFRRKFSIPYRVLKDYYLFDRKGAIVENNKRLPILNLDGEFTDKRVPRELNFKIDLKLGKAMVEDEVISPDSISSLFKVNPVLYSQMMGKEDFLSAKRFAYQNKTFNPQKLKYNRDLIQLEDWRSLNHPPVRDLGDDLTVWDQNYTPIDYQKNESIFYSPDFHQKIDQLSDSELSFGNQLELLHNGDSYQRKLEEVKKAKHSVLIAVMSFYCDDSTVPLEELLIQKAKEGLDIKIMVEKVWTKIAMKSCMRRMIKGGVDVVYSNELLKKGEESALFHDKFMIFDEKRAIMGGENLVASDNISTGFNHLNRDNDLFVEGPVVHDMIVRYSQLWKKFENRKNELNLERYPNRVFPIEDYELRAHSQIALERSQNQRGASSYASVLGNPLKKNLGNCRFINQDPSTDKYKLTKVFMEHIDVAEKQLNMTTGSILFALPEDSEKEQKRETWNKKLFEHIFAASRRGVKLDLIGNGIDGGYGEISNTINRLKLEIRFQFHPLKKLFFSIISNWLNHRAAKKNQPYLEFIENQPNARAWSNFQYMHSKMIQIDRTMNIVSSYNLEEWSADKSHEAALLCLDEGLSHEMDRSFLRDFVNSVPVSNAVGER